MGKMGITNPVIWIRPKYLDYKILMSRAVFHNGELSVVGLRQAESGTYRCRVDFKEAQTRSTFIHLAVIGENFLV